MKTCVYLADISALMSSPVFEGLLPCVPAYRREKTLRFKFQKGKAQSLAVGLLLKKACEDFGFSGIDENVNYGENEKPDFVQKPSGNEFHFNLSHSGNRAMCIVSPHVVGCDVEQVKKGRDGIAERFFLPSENEWIQSAKDADLQSQGNGRIFEDDGVSPQDIAFYRLWTLKECYMKVTGAGMSLSPDRFLVSVEADGRIRMNHDGWRNEYSFFEFDVNDGYRYACAIQKPEMEKPELIICDLVKSFLRQ